MADAESYSKALRKWARENPKTDLALSFVPFAGQAYGAAHAGAAFKDPEATTFDKVAATAGILPFGKLLKGAKGIFDGPTISKMVIGEKGATAAEKEALEAAKRMAAEGEPAPAIFKKTGWWKGKENPWKTEISDEMFTVDDDLLTQMKLNREEMTFLGEAAQHRDLYSRYPSMKDTGLVLTTGRGGSYGDNLVELGKDARPSNILLHESQHGVQDLEGYLKAGGRVKKGRAYLSDPTEVEARVTALRQKMTKEQRKMYPFPLHAQDEVLRLNASPRAKFDPTYEEMERMLRGTGLTPNDIGFDDAIAGF